MEKKVRNIDHSVKVDNKTYNKILKLAKEDQRSIRVTIERAIDVSFREKQKQRLEKTRSTFA